MHALHGNTVIRLNWEGEQLWAKRVVFLSEHLTFEDQPMPLTYSAKEILRYRTSTQSLVSSSEFTPNIKTTPLSDVQSDKTNHRSGRRVKYRDDTGTNGFYKPKKGVKHSLGNNPEFKLINRIHRHNLSHTPPPRGTPGAILADEECSPKGREPNTQSRGAIRRRTRRRLYRQWRRLCKQQAVPGAGSRALPPFPPKKATPNRAKWFRQALLWQGHMVRTKKRRTRATPTTPPMPYSAKFRIGSLNVQGFAETLKLKNSIQIMQEHRLDVLILTETKSTSYYSYQSEGHLVILSGNHIDRNAGVGAIISPQARPHLMDVIQVSNRIIHLAFKKRGGHIHVVGAYAPHAKRDLEQDRQPFWDSLEEHLQRIPQPEPLYLTGDFNVRFQAQHKNDEGVTGPFVYGKGSRYIDHTATSNRGLCVTAMKSLGMVEAASYLTPNHSQQITYRDKAAPPSSWSQFVLDPLILQQFYSKLQSNMQEDALEVAANIRAHLMDDALLPPDRLDPHPDPNRFQRLDHTFVRQQWLSSINSCRSKLHTGFPSDHYLLLTEVQIKLATRHRNPPANRKYDFGKVTITQRYQYNQSLKTALGQLTFDAPLPPPDHTAKAAFFTDGSGSRGRCSASTPAGWGWTMPVGDEWVDARGPVVTQSDHTAYLGASVGSNNTGELTAIAEAILYAMEHEIKEIVIRSDSQWSINVLTGKWRPKTHHTLINRIRQLVQIPSYTIQLRWIKSHVGYEGNERADKLANEGRALAEAVGGRQHAAPVGRRQVGQTTPPVANLAQGMLDAAKQTFDFVRRPARKPWISQTTLEALAAARVAESERRDDARTLRNKAKRLAKKDRIRYIHEQLTEDPAGITKKTWTTARQQKRGFIGKKSHLIVDHKPVPWSKTHEAFRDHLQNQQWAQRVTTPLADRGISTEPLCPAG